MTARLPDPGGDDNTWGTILNGFLDVSHNADGTLQQTAIATAGGALDSAVVHNTGNESIGGIKTFTASPVVPTPTTGTAVANKSYVDNTVSSGAPNATTSTPGILELDGDLGGTYNSPSVTGIQGTQVATTTPSSNQVLQYNNGTSKWTPTTQTTITQVTSSVSTSTAAGSAANTNYTYLASGSITVTLPTAVGNTNKYAVTNVGTGTITIATTGGQTMNGSSSITMAIQYQSRDFVSNNANWIIE